MFTATTPGTVSLMSLLGPGLRSGNIVLSLDQTRNLNRIYGFDEEKPNQRPPRPKPPEPLPPNASWEAKRDYNRALEDHKSAVESWEKWTDPRSFLQAGADRNMIRYAEADGMRLVAWIAKYVEAGEDPLKTLIQMASDAGFDVDPSDIEWANGEEGEEDDEEAPEGTPAEATV
jgi:hypothetical protein